MFELFKTFSMIATIYACVFWAIALSTSAAKGYGPRLYAFLIMLSSSFVFVMMYAKLHHHFDFYSNYLPIHSLLSFSLFPLFYLYIHTLTQASRFRKKNLWHLFFPVLYALMVYLILHLWMDKQERYLFIADAVRGNVLDELRFQVALYTYRIGKIIYVLLSIAYTVSMYKAYKQHKKRSAELFSNEEAASLKWVRTLAILFVSLFIGHLAIQIPSDTFVAENNLLVSFSYLAFAIFYFSLGYYSFKQKQLYLPDTAQFEREATKPKTLKKKHVTEYLALRKPYLNPDFSLYDMCIYFDTNRTYLSALINNDFQVNFRTLINQYRIEESKTLLFRERFSKHPISLEYIASQSGFQSYLSFARVFKQEVGMPPSEYRDKLKKQNTSHYS